MSNSVIEEELKNLRETLVKKGIEESSLFFISNKHGYMNKYEFGALQKHIFKNIKTILKKVII